jgi:hypothetical protein
LTSKGVNFSFDIRDKTLFFLGGMRENGKTSELAKYVKDLHRPIKIAFMK